MYNHRCLLLTSTVYPSISGYASSIEQRKEEYIQAVNFYLKKTPYDIVIVDNSSFDFSHCFHNERIECLTYQAPNEDAQFGKGYGEAKLMNYAFKHSLKLSLADQVIKITGRHIIKNINMLLRYCNNPNIVYADVDLKLLYAHSYFFVAPPIFFKNYLLPNYSLMNDGKGVHFEHILGKQLIEWRKAGNKHSEFVLPIYIIGHQGTSATPYKSPHMERYIKIFVKYLICEFRYQINK